MRYQGHMNWDISLPSLVGYVTTMLQNPNNVALQGGPATTVLEAAVARDICRMIGFDESAEAMPWAHLCCDGTVANIEGVWAAREMKYFPLGVKYALENDETYTDAIDHPEKIKVTFRGGEVPLVYLGSWDLVNLPCDSVLSLAGQVARQMLPDAAEEETIQAKEAEVWKDLAEKYSVNALGIFGVYRKFGLDGEGIALPAVIVPSTKHYSWPKAASLLGAGHGVPLSEAELVDPDAIRDQGILNVFVDAEGRMKPELLDGVLDACARAKKPVLMVVGVFGSTEESAVDPITRILEARERTRKPDDSRAPALEFNVHTDAAYGGYLLSVIREDYPMPWPGEAPAVGAGARPVADRIDMEIRLKAYVKRQLDAIRLTDSVTIDPHKWGYVAYPAGSLSYRNGKMVNLVTFGAPYIGSDSGGGGVLAGLGESGVEGSKPGASAAAVFLSHWVIRPTKSGHGEIINRSLLNARLFYIYITGMVENARRKKKPSERDPGYTVLPFNELMEEYRGEDAMTYLVDTFYQDKPLGEILSDDNNAEFVNEVGPDQNIVDYIFNIAGNTDAETLKEFNEAIYEKVYPEISEGNDPAVGKYEIFITKTTFHRKDYGDEFMTTLAGRLGLSHPAKVSEIPCMRSVVMDPWAVETGKPGEGNFFKETFIPALDRVIRKVLTEKELG